MYPTSEIKLVCQSPSFLSLLSLLSLLSRGYALLIYFSFFSLPSCLDFVLVKFDELEMLLSAQVEQYHQTELAKHKERLSNDGVRYQAQKQYVYFSRFYPLPASSDPFASSCSLPLC